jgi:hypothetical protein
MLRPSFAGCFRLAHLPSFQTSGCTSLSLDIGMILRCEVSASLQEYTQGGRPLVLAILITWSRARR